MKENEALNPVIELFVDINFCAKLLSSGFGFGLAKSGRPGWLAGWGWSGGYPKRNDDELATAAAAVDEKGIFHRGSDRKTVRGSVS